jgi:hypothetical protein
LKVLQSAVGPTRQRANLRALTAMGAPSGFALYQLVYLL